MTAPLSPAQLAGLNGAPAAAAGGNAPAGSADRFLKLLVAQMQNQDPLNPLDNAQVTSQMAQINTVNGIEKLNATVQALDGQFVGLQLMQGAALIGREVSVDGDRLAVADGKGRGGYELGAAAGKVTLEVLSPGGRVVQTVELGAQDAGRQSFAIDASRLDAATPWRFRVTAQQAGQAVEAAPLALDRVRSVGARDGRLTLELERAGPVPSTDIAAVH